VVLNSIWDTLGIAQTTDIRLIKKTYSKRLKHNKPDENPAGFQQLHQAYKAAIQEAKWLTERQASESEIIESAFRSQEDDPQNRHQAQQQEIREQFQYGEIVNTYQPPATETRYRYRGNPIYPEKPDYQGELDRLLGKVDDLIEECKGYDQSAWQFLLECEYILQPEFCDELGLALFRRIVRYFNQEEHKKQGDYAIDVNILFYLNDIFRWNLYQLDYCSHLDSKHGLCQINKLRDYDAKKQGAKQDVFAGLCGLKAVKKSVQFGVLAWTTAYDRICAYICCVLSNSISQ
jgi:hypothetical protein